jgi:hypothetical protein
MNLLIAVTCSACSRESLTLLDFTAYNHTDQGVGEYSISIPNGGGGGAGYLDPGAGGGGYTCCISIPSVWRPGITVIVSRTTMVNNVETTIKQVVSLPKYDAKTASTMNIHFMRDGSVKAFVTRIMLGHPDYPLKGKEAELKPGVPITIRWP